MSYYLSGFDAKTGRRLVFQEIPGGKKLEVAKKNAGIGHPFPDFAGDKHLSKRAAGMIAELIGVPYHAHLDYYISPVAVGGTVQVTHV